ncbi:MAG: hypothetical protein RL754_227 [Bacteroidota bacterium]|jgi:hypothetical protein
MRNILPIIVAIATLMSSCRPDPKTITVEVRTTYNGSPIISGETYYKGDTAIKFDLFHFYLSNLAVGQDSIILGDAMFINADDSASHFYELNLKDHQGGVHIGIGLDSLQNSADPTAFPTTHPLSSANAMYWSWATKYRFFKIDGRTNASGAFGVDDNLLAWHTGLDELYRTANFNADVNPGDHLIFELRVEELIRGISLATETVTHTTVDDVDIAIKLSDNAVEALVLRVE